tara:strand:- start:277 stop:633 length:357 start_codon:yes stop_codon:yes gene_type:complete
MSHTIGDLDYHRKVAATGACLQYDRFGADFLYESWDCYQEPDDDTVIAGIAQLIEEGLSEQIMVSHDVCYRIQLSRFGGKGFSHIPRSVTSKLMIAGVSEEVVTRITHENPARIFGVR